MSVFLDNAATTFPKPESVYRAMDTAMREVGVAPGRGGYQQGLAAARIVFSARSALAEFFGVTDSSRLIFTHSATESLNIAVNGLLKPGDHVVSSTMEHNALVRPLHLMRGRGVEVTFVQGQPDGSVRVEDIAAALRPNTRLVALAHCSNVTGTLQPIGEIGRLARKCGARFLVDAAQSAGYFPIDVGELGIDLFAAPGHKGLFAPPGTGILALGPEVELDPLLVGGTGSKASSPEQPEELPDRFESGTLNTPGIAGLLAGLEFVKETGLGQIAEKEHQLVEQVLEGLRALPGTVVYGPGPGAPRGNAISFNLAGQDPATVGFLLDRTYEISVRVGLHCAPDVHRTIGSYPAGTVRVSPGYFTSAQDIEYFLRALKEIADKR
ncbi:aminotransferase class V-fold PLP-dependent enzyme [Geomonas silvestris]|nr:aminotransferase class V-fold PLP-dependent enzyme [Geomonas silvestris]